MTEHIQLLIRAAAAQLNMTRYYICACDDGLDYFYSSSPLCPTTFGWAEENINAAQIHFFGALP